MATDSSASPDSAASAAPASVPVVAYIPYSKIHALHASAVLFTGGLLLSVGVLTGGIAWQQRNEHHLASAAVWSICGVLWLILAVQSFRHRPLVQLAIAGSAVLTAAVTVLNYRYSAPLLSSLNEALPSLYRYCGVAGALVAMGAGGALWRLLRAHGGTERPWTMRQLAVLATALVFLMALPVAIIPGSARQAAHDEVAGMARKFPVNPEPKLRLGGASSLVLGATLQAPYVTQARAEEALADFNAELGAIKKSGAEWVSIEIRQDALPLSASPDFQFVKAYVQRARAEGLKIMLVQGPASSETARRMDWDAYIKTQPDRTDWKSVSSEQRERLVWQAFTSAQRERTVFFVEQLRPDAFVLCASPLKYIRQGNIAGSRRDDAKKDKDEKKRSHLDIFLDDWTDHFMAVLAAARHTWPGAESGIALQPAIPEDTEIYRRMRKAPEVDFVAIELYTPAQTDAFYKLCDKFKHPRVHGKRAWIYECFNGQPLANPRDSAADAEWLSAAAGWAQVHHFDALFVKAYGALIPDGTGTALAEHRLAQLWQDARQGLSPVGERCRELSRRCGLQPEPGREEPAAAPNNR